MGFYIEEMPTELNGISLKEADYLADEFLKDTPCDRMWDAVRALRDFYEIVRNEAVEVADRKTEPITNDDYIETENDHFEARCLNCVNNGSYKCSKCDGEMYFKTEPQTETGTDCSWR